MEGWGSNYTLCAQGTKRRLITESRTGAHDAGRGRQEKGEPQHRPPRGQWCPTRGGAAARVGKTRARKLEEKKASVRGLENALEGRAAASAAATSNGALARVGAAAHVGKTRARKLAEKRASARGLDNAFQRRRALTTYSIDNSRHMWYHRLMARAWGTAGGTAGSGIMKGVACEASAN